MYQKARSYGGVKGRPSQGATAARTRQANQVLKAFRAGSRSGPAPYIPLRATGELKGCDFDWGNSGASMLNTTTTNVDIVPVNLVQAGAASFNRVGRKIKLKSLRLTGEIRLTCPAATASGSIVRICVIWDKQPAGVLPVWSSIFGTTVQTGVEASNNLLEPLRYDNQDRFRLLRDLKIPINLTANGTTSGIEEMCVDEYIPLKGLETAFSGQSSPMTIADVSSGGLYVAVRCTNLVGVTTLSMWSNNARLRYYD